MPSPIPRHPKGDGGNRHFSIEKSITNLHERATCLFFLRQRQMEIFLLKNPIQLSSKEPIAATFNINEEQSTLSISSKDTNFMNAFVLLQQHLKNEVERKFGQNTEIQPIIKFEDDSCVLNIKLVRYGKMVKINIVNHGDDSKSKGRTNFNQMNNVLDGKQLKVDLVVKCFGGSKYTDVGDEIKCKFTFRLEKLIIYPSKMKTKSSKLEGKLSKPNAKKNSSCFSRTMVRNLLKKKATSSFINMAIIGLYKQEMSERYPNPKKRHDILRFKKHFDCFYNEFTRKKEEKFGLHDWSRDEIVNFIETHYQIKIVILSNSVLIFPKTGKRKKICIFNTYW